MGQTLNASHYHPFRGQVGVRSRTVAHLCGRPSGRALWAARMGQCPPGVAQDVPFDAVGKGFSAT